MRVWPKGPRKCLGGEGIMLKNAFVYIATAVVSCISVSSASATIIEIAANAGVGGFVNTNRDFIPGIIRSERQEYDTITDTVIISEETRISAINSGGFFSVFNNNTTRNNTIGFVRSQVGVSRNNGPLSQINAFADVSVDARRGTIRSLSTGNHFTSGGDATGNIFEVARFVPGSNGGTITFNLDYDGSWAVGPNGPTGQAQVSIGLFGGSSQAQGVGVIISPGVDGLSGRVSDSLSISYFSFNPISIPLQTTLFTQLSGGPGSFQFDNTARLSYSVTPGSSVTFNDPAFLTAVNALPEPGTIALFGLGLLGLGVAAKRARSAPKVA